LNVEVFARDDGSSDGTLAVLARYAGHWPSLAAPITGPNLGPAMSFLTLLSAAPDDFDYYAFCDQDDVWLPGKLARAALALGALDRPALYCSAVMCVDQALRPLGERRIGGDASFEQLLFQNVAYGATVVINAAARAGIVARLPDGDVIMHDWWCALWAAAFGVIIRDDEPGLLYRQHAANAVGASPDRSKELAAQLRLLARDHRRYYRVYAQDLEFQRLHGAALDPPQRRSLDRFINARRSTASRLAFAVFGPVTRSDFISTLAARLLIAVNWY
jgi:glycosyltransferase involved in cell wall biosynthesis